MNEKTKLGDMAFEHGVDGETELWRVMSFRAFNDKSFRNTNWFSTKAEAEAHAEWINDGRGKVLSITQYRKVD